MWDLIKKYWDLLGGIICGIVMSFLASFKLDKIQLIYSIIILMLVSIGLFKVFRTYIDDGKKKRKKIVIDKLVDGQNAMKAISMAQNPTKSGEELANLLIVTGKGGGKVMKKFLKWVVTYWQQILGLLTDFAYLCLLTYAYIFDKFGFILELLPDGVGWEIGVKVAVGVISVLGVALNVRNQVKWVGVGSLEDAEEYLNSKTKETSSKLSDTAKNTVKKTLKTLNSTLKTLKDNLSKSEDALAKAEEALTSSRELLSLNLCNNEQVITNAQSVNKIKVDIDTIKRSIEETEAKIKKYESVL